LYVLQKIKGQKVTSVIFLEFFLVWKFWERIEVKCEPARSYEGLAKPLKGGGDVLSRIYPFYEPAELAFQLLVGDVHAG
jgi:hypothetical protein